MAYDKIMKQPTPNKIRPKTDFSGSQTIDESTNYERYENGPGPGNSMWTNAKKIKGAKEQRFGIPGLGRKK